MPIKISIPSILHIRFLYSPYPLYYGLKYTANVSFQPVTHRFFRYSVGDIPVCFLNSRLKYSGLSYPTMEATSVTL